MSTTKPPKAKKTLSTRFRQENWEKYVGDHMRHECFAGCGKTITTFDFECGHIIAEARGGENTHANIIPICAQCNRSMGAESMLEFCERNNFAPSLDLQRLAREQDAVIREHHEQRETLATTEDATPAISQALAAMTIDARAPRAHPRHTALPTVVPVSPSSFDVCAIDIDATIARQGALSALDREIELYRAAVIERQGPESFPQLARELFGEFLFTQFGTTAPMDLVCAWDSKCARVILRQILQHIRTPGVAGISDSALLKNRIDRLAAILCDHLKRARTAIPVRKPVPPIYVVIDKPRK